MVFTLSEKVRFFRIIRSMPILCGFWGLPFQIPKFLAVLYEVGEIKERRVETEQAMYCIDGGRVQTEYRVTS